MKIIPCILDHNNQLALDQNTVGALLREKGYQHLWSERQKPVDTIVVHYTSAVNTNSQNPFDLRSIIAIFCEYKVSSHYLITREGAVYQFVAEEHKAWHCGGSIMPEPDNRTGVNDFSVGIELVATAQSGFTDSQYEKLSTLCKAIQKRWHCGSRNVVGHDMISGVRAVSLGLRQDCKEDPGGLFDWQRLKKSLSCPN